MTDPVTKIVNSGEHKQVTSNFAAANAPLCECSWLLVTILSLVKPVAETRFY